MQGLVATFIQLNADLLRCAESGASILTCARASFAIARELMELAQTEGRMPCITDIHSIVRTGDGQVSIWLELDNPNANNGNGVLFCHVDERALLGMDQADILRARQAIAMATPNTDLSCVGSGSFPHSLTTQARRA